MAQNLARAVARLVCTSPFMINISIGGHVHSRSIPRTPRQLSSSEQRWKENNIDGERVTCVTISWLPSSSVSFQFKSAPNSLRLSFPADLWPPRVLARSNLPPTLKSFFLMAVPGVLSSEGPSLYRFCCSNVLSAPHITSEPPKLRTDTFFENKKKISDRAPAKPLHRADHKKTPEFREKKP